MIILEIIAILYGYYSHKTRPLVYRNFGNGWRELISYTVGVLLVSPVFIAAMYLLLRLAGYEKRETQRLSILAAAAYFAAFGPFGVGTFLGWATE